MLWIDRDHRKDGWGTKILAAADGEARRRGCDRVCASSGYAETGRTLGIPGEGEDVQMFKRL
jgi:GNAT superfamily N-acetyltransferase